MWFKVVQKVAGVLGLSGCLLHQEIKTCVASVGLTLSLICVKTLAKKCKY